MLRVDAEEGRIDFLSRWEPDSYCHYHLEGDLHMEYGGAEGTHVYFSCKAVDGKLFDVVDRDGTVLRSATVDERTNEFPPWDGTVSPSPTSAAGETGALAG